MAATSRLTVYNEALREIGALPLGDTTTPDPRLLALAGAWDHAVEYTIGRLDWNFARRRATLAGIADVTYPPFTYRYARPAGYLRKCWIKAAPADEFQIDHTESGLLIYGFLPAAVVEFMSDDATNADPASWPPQFTRCMALYLALLVAPKIGRAGDDDTAKALWQKLSGALEEASGQEVAFSTNKQIAADRLPVMRRSLEMIGHVLTGSTMTQSQTDYLRWAMDRTWSDCVEFVLAQAPWNFATRRVILNGAADTSFPPYTFRYARPTNYIRRSWLKTAATDTFEADFGEFGNLFRGYAASLVLEYTARDSTALSPTSWTPQFREAIACYLAMQVAGRVTMSNGEGGDVQATASKARDELGKQFQAYLEAARAIDVTTFSDKNVPSERLPVMRRAIEFIGQALAGFGMNDEIVGRLRWAMTQSWDHSVRSCLEQGAWNFASKRALFAVGNAGSETVPLTEIAGISDGYSVIPEDGDAPADFTGFLYGYPLPTDFRHKLWFKSSAHDEHEARHQIIRDHIFTDCDAAAMEYVAEDEWTTAPGNWPATFLDVVAAHLAASVALELTATLGERGAVKITATQMKDRLDALYQRRLSDARNKDAIQQQAKRIPMGSFARARFGGNRYRNVH